MADGVSWRRVKYSKELSNINGKLMPNDVVVSHDGALVDKSGVPVFLNLRFIYFEKPDRFEGMEHIQCVGIEGHSGFFDPDLLGQIDWEAAKEAAFGSGAELDSPERPREVSLTATSAGEFYEKSRELSKNLELAEVAMVYLQAPNRGTQNVLEYLKYGSKATAIRRVAEARKAGLIPPVDAPDEVYEEFRKAIEENWPK